MDSVEEEVQVMATIGNSTAALPTFLPITEAANKYNMTENLLTRLVRDGRIEAAQLPSGEILVSGSGIAQTRTKQQIIRDDYRHLREVPISISAAAAKYDVPAPTIRGWVTRKYITVIDSGYPMMLDESEIAFCARIHHERRTAGIHSTAPIPLLDENQRPCQLKHPDLLEYRRRKREVAYVRISERSARQIMANHPEGLISEWVRPFSCCLNTCH
jgi:hypothetical protein